MNILLFVMSLLMMLALLTYGRLDMYRSFVVTQGEFERYMTENERDVINSGAQQWYDRTTLSTKNGGPKKSAPKEASAKLGVHWLFNAETKNVAEEAVSREIFKKLIYNVFSGQDYFQKALEKDPQLVDDLIHALQTSGQKLTAENKRIKTTDGLENIDLENHSLQDVYYWMLKGYPSTRASNTSSILESNEEIESAEENENLIAEHVHNEDRISLLDFITINPQKTKIRLFLAPKALLLAVFDDLQTVEDLMQTRWDLYRQIVNDKDNATLSDQFKHKFESRVHNIPPSMLDYTVTGTNPRQYEVQ